MTSSPSSLLFADAQVALLAAVTDVAENSLFTFADASDAAAFGAAARVAEADAWLNAQLTFAGPISGRFAVTLPRALARRLCAAFAGANSPEDMSDDNLTDFTGELANMVCGLWLTRTCQHEAFDLTPPVVRRGTPDAVGGSGGEGLESTSVYLAIDETPVRLEVDWAAAGLTRESGAPEGADAR